MTKNELHKAVGGNIAKASIKKGDSGLEIHGHFAICEPIYEDGCLDVWIVNNSQGGFFSGLSEHKLTGIIKRIKDRGIGEVNRLSGEAWFRCDFSQLDAIYPILGIRKSPGRPKNAFKEDAK